MHAWECGRGRKCGVASAATDSRAARRDAHLVKGEFRARAGLAAARSTLWLAEVRA